MNNMHNLEAAELSAFEKYFLKTHSRITLAMLRSVLEQSQAGKHPMHIVLPSAPEPVVVSNTHEVIVNDNDVEATSETTAETTSEANPESTAIQAEPDEIVYRILDQYDLFQELEKQREHILREIKAHGQLTPELEQKINSTYSLPILEDLYLPYKLKGRTTATAAKEAGLQELANWIWQLGNGEIEATSTSLETKALEYIKPDTSYNSYETVLQGAIAILAEKVAENADLRNAVRISLLRKSRIRSIRGPKAKDKSKFTRFFDYREPIGSLKKVSNSHRYLSLRKGWATNELILSFERGEEGILAEKFENFACSKKDSAVADILHKAARLALNGNVFTGIEHEIHKSLKDQAEEYLIDYFASGIRKRLLHPPMGNKIILGIDAGLDDKPATLALINETGDLLVHNSFSIEKEEEWEKIKPELEASLAKIHLSAVAILHGSKGKIARKRLEQLLLEKSIQSPVIMVYEQAAHIYSTSSVAKEELPDIDPGIRRAVFAARFLQNPIRELVKVDPKFLATGAFQFDINPNKLGKSLYRTIQACVCKVGVHIGTASRSMLAYLPGIDHNLAKSIISFRKNRGIFEKIEDLKSVPEMNEKIFLQAQAYLRTSEPAIDPRGEYKAQSFFFHSTPIADVKAEGIVPGIITNITNFGVFVDIGAAQDGLLHISEFSDNTSPYELMLVGDAVSVWVTGINTEKNQISLSLKSPEEKRALAEKRRPRRPRFQPRDGNRGEAAPRRRPPASREQEASGAPTAPNNRDGRDGRQRNFRKDRSPTQSDDRQKKEAAVPKKKVVPQRDPKTGAVMKMDESIYTSEKKKQGPRFATKAKTTTFNPFANLGDLLKNKSQDE